MPLYEYKCEECGTKFEKLVSLSETNIACAKCDSNHVTKQFSVFAARVSEGGSSEMPSQDCGGCSMPSQGMCDRNQ